MLPSRELSVWVPGLSPLCHFPHCSPQRRDFSPRKCWGARHTLRSSQPLCAPLSLVAGLPQEARLCDPPKPGSAVPSRKPFLTPNDTNRSLICSPFLHCSHLSFLSCCGVIYTLTCWSPHPIAPWWTVFLTLPLEYGVQHKIMPRDSLWNGYDVNFNSNHSVKHYVS